MDWQTLIRPRVLIVEDVPEQLRGDRRDLDAISVESRRDLGIDKFAFSLAQTVEEAERLFPQTGEAPFDLLILDLGIPEKEGEIDVPENGQRLLERVHQDGIAKEVIVTSIWYVAEQVVRAFRSGVVDFIAKPFTSEVLQAKVLECWKRLLSKESARLLGEERIGELVPYAEKGLAHQFSTCFAKLVRVVAQSAEEMEEHMHERYGLHRRKDSQDVFFQWLEGQKDSVAHAKKEWEALQSSLTLPDESYREETVDALLRDVNQQLLPCSIVKNMEMKFSGESATPVLTFENDVRAVLKEIIAGAMNERQDYSMPKQALEINVSGGKGQVEVSFADTLEPISPDDARQINEGVSVSPHLRFKREWGLSVVQHVAMRGGGRLQVSPQPERGNVITYFIPLAN
jgi:response regulator of citrate/malate metabolism